MNESAAVAVFEERRWRERTVRAALIAAGILPFVPLLANVPLLGGLANVVDGWFAFQCHREAGRSLSMFGAVLPVCSRCAGIYFGLGLGGLAARPRLAARPLRIWVGAAALVMLLDVATELAGLRPPWMPLRFATGIALAYPVAVALVCAARGVQRT